MSTSESASHGSPAADSPPPSRLGVYTLRYTVARLAVLVIALAILYALGLRGLLLLICALGVSGIASWFMLRTQRTAMSAAVVERASHPGRFSQWVERNTTGEDVDEVGDGKTES